MESGPITMSDLAWRQIDVGSDFEDGINFYGEFDAPLANQALQTLHTALEQRGTPCYCLRLCLDHDQRAFFSGVGEIMAPEHAYPVPSGSALSRVPLQRLVPNIWTWWPLAVREGPPANAWTEALYSQEVQAFMRRVRWQAQIRLQNHEEYIGYFKLAGVDGNPLPTDHDLLAAAYRTKLDVARLIAYRHVQESSTVQHFKDRLNEAVTAVSSPHCDSRIALRHVADMLTSHLGAGWNRAACFCRVSDTMLQCLWAQGGLDPSWCETVERPVGENIREYSELVEFVRGASLPLNDAYFSAAADTDPVMVDLGGDSPIADLWRSNGNIRALRSEYQRWELCTAPIAHLSVSNRQELKKGGPKAAEFRQEDSWVREVNDSRPEPIFISQNETYFAVPWFSRDELIGIWVVDMAYWSRLSEQPGIPSLVLTAEILEALGPAMDRHRRNHWGRL